MPTGGVADFPLVITPAAAEKLMARIQLIDDFSSLEDFLTHSIGKPNILKVVLKGPAAAQVPDDSCE